MLRIMRTSRRLTLGSFRTVLLALVVHLIAASWASAVGLVYVDADDGFVTANPNLSPLSAINSNVSALDSLWGFRGLFGSEASIFESSINANPGAEDSPELTMTLNTSHGLVSGSNYDIYLAYWSSNGANWSIRGRLASGPPSLFNRTGPLAFLPAAVAGTPATSVNWAIAPTSCTDTGAGMAFHAICSTQDDRTMYLGKVGTAVAIGGQIQVFIDDLPTTEFDPDITPANAVNFRSWLDGVAFIEAGTPLSLQVTVNRNNGNLTIANNTGNAVSFTSLSISSASQALNAANWTSITNNYDQGGTLDTDAWEITAPTIAPPPGFTGVLTEIESAGGAGGATLNNGASVNLGNVWNDTRFEDLQIQLALTTGVALTLTPTYTGTAQILGDLDNSGAVTFADYQKLSLNLHTNVSALGQAEAYLRGDMNGDLLINYADFVALRNVFVGPGGASFGEFVPEPASAFMGVLGVLVASTLCRVRQTNVSRTSNAMKARLSMFVIALAAWAMFLAVEAQAINVNLNAGDALGGTSFNAAGNWSNAQAPGPGNSYFTGNFGLRTPPDASSYTFGGDSLTVDNTNFDPGMPAAPNGGLWYKGTGNTGVITINNLILNGGLITHINGQGDLFQLAGNINVIANSFIQARQGAINISAVISGSGNITNPNSDGPGRTLRFLSPNSTYTGSIINNGRFELPDNGRLNFVIGASGVSNSVSGTGAETIFGGDFNFNLSGASSTLGDSWTIVSSTNRTFGPTFNIPGFFEYATGLWVNGNYQFNETTGVLSVAPPPELLTLRVNATNGATSIVNTITGASFDMNYYEVRSPSGQLNVAGWTSIDGNIPASQTTWEKAGGSTANLISETNLLGMQTLASTQNVSVGPAFAGTLPEHRDLEFYYGTVGASGTLFRGFVEYITSTAVAGDYNLNGRVDIGDYTIWRDTLGSTTDLRANGDNIGASADKIDVADYNYWKARYGNTGSSSGGAAGHLSSVPEPSTILIVWLAIACGPLMSRFRGGN